MNFCTCVTIFCIISIFIPSESSASSQITKLVPVEDWIAFKRRTSDIKPFDKFLGKLRATYDFVFHKTDNVSNVDKILTEDTSQVLEKDEPQKFILTSFLDSNQSVINQTDEQAANYTNIFLQLLPEKDIEPSSGNRESSISRISKDNEWLDDIEVPEPLSELEIVDDDENVDRSVENVTPQAGVHLPIAVARALGKWIASILGFTRGAYLTLTHSSA